MATSAIPAISSAILPWFNVLDYGAIANDAFDCTAAFNAAIQAAGPDGTVYVPRGTYKILGQINMVNGDGSLPLPSPWGWGWPSKLVGDGREVSTLHIPASAVGTQTDATIHASVGITITDLGFVYDQPNNPDYTTLPTFNHYKPVIKIDPIHYTAGDFNEGVRLARLRIEGAWDGVEAIGITTYQLGRNIFEDIEISMFNYGFNLDGYVDSTRMDKIHVWPFGITTRTDIPSQYMAFALQGHSIGIRVGKHPDLRVTNSLFGNGTAVFFRASDVTANAGTYAGFVNCHFDGPATIKIGQGFPVTGQVMFTDCRFGCVGPTSWAGGTITGGVVGSYITIAQCPVLFTGCIFEFLGAATLDAPFLNSSGDYIIQISNCLFYMASNDQTAILSTGRGIEVSNCNFYRTTGTNYSAPAISVTAGRAMLIGNHCRDPGGGSGVFLDLSSTDAYHIVAGNTALGWSINWPTGSTTVRGFGNQMLGGPGQNQSLGVKQLTLEGGSSNNLKILSGSGSPAGVVTADPGSLYLNTSGSVYVKQTGTGTAGWSTALS